MRLWPGVEHMPHVYEALTQRSETGMAKLRRKLLQHVSGDVLEIGVGVGFNLPHYRPDARVTALDIEPNNVRYAARKPQATTVRLLVADAQRLPFADHSFDNIVATLVLCSVDAQPPTFVELRRMLRPGGRLNMIEHQLSGHPAVDWLLNSIETPWGWVTGGCHPNRSTATTLTQHGWQLLQHQRYAGGVLRFMIATPA